MAKEKVVVLLFNDDEIGVIAMAVDHYRSCCIKHSLTVGPGKNREWFRWEADYLDELLGRIRSNIKKP